MGEEIEVHWDPARGLVRLKCSAEAIARIAQRIADEVPLPDDVAVAEIQYIEAYNTERPAPPQKRWEDRVALLGCGLIGFVLLTIFIAGVVQIVALFSG